MSDETHQQVSAGRYVLALALIIAGVMVAAHGLWTNYASNRAKLSRVVSSVSLNNNVVGMFAWTVHSHSEMLSLRVFAAMRPGQGPPLDGSIHQRRIISLSYDIWPEQIDALGNRLSDDLVAIAANEAVDTPVSEPVLGSDYTEWGAKLLDSHGIFGINGYSRTALLIPILALITLTLGGIVCARRREGISFGASALLLAVAFFEVFPHLFTP